MSAASLPPHTAPCGAWASPLSPAALASASLRLSFCSLGADGSVFWVEGRPLEGGRQVLVRRDPSGAVDDVTPAPFNCRSRVHEYGGRPYVVTREEIVFVNDRDQRLYQQRHGEAPHPLSPAEGLNGETWRFAEPLLDAARARLICVGERHQHGQAHPENLLVGISLADGAITPLLRGADFYAAPCLSPDGARLAFLSWNNPHMPWDAAGLFVADLDAAGGPGLVRHVAGDARASAFQPGFAADGDLYFVWEPEGFWNLHRLNAKALVGGGPIGTRAIENVCPLEGELGAPLWSLGTTTWGFLDEREAICAVVRDGVPHLARIDLRGGQLAGVPIDPAAAGPASIGHIAAGGGRAALLVGWADRATSVGLYDGGRGTFELLRTSSALDVPRELIARAEPLVFSTSDGDTAHGFFYAPKNPAFTPLPGEAPPLIVTAHGGPTGAASAALSLAIQFWTTRGFGVLDVNYRGSTGYGRAYRDRLAGMWGVYDVDDCVAGARALAAQGRVDGRRLAIRGGSAGGFTVLAALAFRDAFAAGASHYGVSDLEALQRDTHKFEARYNDWLVGPYPERRDLYVERSPVHASERLSCPVIFFQGLEDKVVPPSQAEAMVAALQAKGLAAEYHAFGGEQHGFRRAETIERVYAAELAFYGRIFGFSPA